MLVSWTIKKFLEELSSKKPAPGGGSAAALAGAMAAALVSMAAKLSGDRKTAVKAGRLMKVLVELISRDAESFKRVIEEKYSQAALKEATEIPLQTAKYSYEVLKLAEVLLENCNPNVITDIGAVAKMAEAAVRGALLNVKVNLALVKNDDYKKEINQAIDKFYLADYLARTLLDKIQARLH